MAGDNPIQSPYGITNIRYIPSLQIDLFDRAESLNRVTCSVNHLRMNDNA